MNIIYSLLLAINIIYPFKINLPDLDTDFNTILKKETVYLCLDDENQACLWNMTLSLEKDIPYRTIYYFDDTKKLTQISITFYGFSDITDVGNELYLYGTFIYKITLDNNDNIVIHIFNSSTDDPQSEDPPKKGFNPDFKNLNVISIK